VPARRCETTPTTRTISTPVPTARDRARRTNARLSVTGSEGIRMPCVGRVRAASPAGPVAATPARA
jgi:hypothetical protein